MLASILAVVAVVALGAGMGWGLPSTNLATVPSASANPSPSVAVPDVAPEPEPEPEPVPQDLTFTFVAAGDVLPHGPVNSSARDGNTFDYAPLMKNIRPYIEGADLAVCHMEVPVTPEGQQPSGYPMFAAPPELVPALANEGWNGCTTASNHSVDRRFLGVTTTLDAFDAERMGNAGTARTKEESLRPQIYKVRQGSRIIQVANISFAYGLNGLPMPSEAPWAVNVFDADAADAQPIIDAAQAARDAGADVVIASVHCCVEYREEPTAAQRRLVEKIAESGTVDLYVGHHGHVPQPIEKLDGGPYGDGMWAAFGLGNFLSNQDTQCCRNTTNSGVLMTATFTVAEDGHVNVGVEWTAITVDRLNKHTMHILNDIHEGTGRLSATEAQARHDRVASAVGSQATERTEPASSLADATFPVRRQPYDDR
jgi:poly-gamma-glutamate capsule biosynthesis protein CapA/YwtB (metallophosphatase superfamily)